MNLLMRHWIFTTTLPSLLDFELHLYLIPISFMATLSSVNGFSDVHLRTDLWKKLGVKKEGIETKLGMEWENSLFLS